jgi:hemoglobin
MDNTELNIYEYVGGEPTFRKLVDAFYARVERDDVLRPMFPDDLDEGKHWQFLFLSQYFGGPRSYLDERGHPRLRIRHAPFPIDQRARDHWLKHMLAALDEAGIQEPALTAMRNYFEYASTHMINAYSVKDLPDGT